MKSSPKISIITPVYNVEQYLPKCIESVLAQTYPDFELILVDDGSTDNSGKICDEYAEKDSRIRVFHTINSGASQARNRGLAVAKGLYIGWVDADDWIEPEMYELLQNEICKYNADIVECVFIEHNNSHERLSWISDRPVMGNDDFILRQFFDSKMKPCVWNKLYKKDIIINEVFPNARLHHDFYVNLNISLRKLQYVRIPDVLYHYQVRPESITTSITGRQMREAIYLFDHTLNLTRNPHLSKRAVKYLKRDAINRLLNRYTYLSKQKILLNQKIYSKIIRKRLGFNFYSYLVLRKVHIKTKVNHLLLLFDLFAIHHLLFRNISKSYKHNS